MKISIITATYNSEKTLRGTIESVIGQNGIELEYIIVDGGSTDGTLAIVGQYKDNVAKTVSEPDKGIYDAMNKGIKMATGDVIGILNSDDFYCDKNVLSKVVSSFADSGVDACYGDIIFVDKEDIKKIVRTWVAGGYSADKLKSGWIPPHPAFFCRREVYEKFGLYRTDMRLAADYEFMLRCLMVYKIRLAYIHEPLVYMRNEGASSKNIKNRFLGWSELKKGWTVNNLSIPRFFILRRVLSKLSQFLVR